MGAPEYRLARQQFAAKDYRGALEKVDGLLARTGLTEQDRAYLLRQRQICQDAIAGKKPNITSATSANVVADRQVKRSVAPADCGPQALLLVCQKLNIPPTEATPEGLRSAAGTGKNGTTLAGLKKAAESVGLVAEGVQMDLHALARLETPAVAWMDGNHYIAVLSVHGDTATVHDPNRGEVETVPLSQLLARSGGVLLTLNRPTEGAATKTEAAPANSSTSPKGG
jgi:hypothetical protein